MSTSDDVRSVTTLYEVLHVDRRATIREVEVACLALAETCRPEVTSTPEAKRLFAELELAYETLLDPVKRAAYDEAVRKIESSVGSVTPSMLPFGVRFRPRTYEEAAAFDSKLISISGQIMDMDGTDDARVQRHVLRLQDELEKRHEEIRALFRERKNRE